MFSNIHVMLTESRRGTELDEIVQHQTNSCNIQFGPCCLGKVCIIVYIINYISFNINGLIYADQQIQWRNSER
jgi:hypothetical protein